jgi:hypothetical protein
MKKSIDVKLVNKLRSEDRKLSRADAERLAQRVEKIDQKERRK